MKLLVTGAAGFIGSNFVRYMLEQSEVYTVTALDALSYAGNLENLAGLTERYGTRCEFVKADIASALDIDELFDKGRFDAVVNFAAETHVDRSLMDVAPFIRANVLGVQILLDACRWKNVRRFLQVSTDEVYGSLGPAGKFSESSPIQPNNPYAATKAAADFLVRAAHETHALDTVITRCSNNFGPYQFPEKLIPLMIANALEDKTLPVYGDGLHVRDWIYVRDHCAAIHAVLEKGAGGEIYNIGGNHDVPNLEIVRTILKEISKPESLIRHIEDRPGHDRRYAMDTTRIRETLGWQPAHSFEQAMKETVSWYLANGQWLDRVRSGAYTEYYERLYGSRLRQGKRIRE